MFKGGGGVAPKSNHQTIRLDSQEVVIRLKKGSYVVNVVFSLFNTGETTTEWIGFPKWTASRTPSFPTFITFQGWVNGKKIDFNEKWGSAGGNRTKFNMSHKAFSYFASKPMKEEHKWLVSQATFPGHAQTLIRVTYEAPYYGKGHTQASYIYGTGSLWKDNIQKAVFIIDSTEVGGSEAISTYFEPRSWSKSAGHAVKAVARPLLKNLLRYEIRDFEPDPGAYFRIQFKKSNYMRPPANYVRSKNLPRGPVYVRPPLPTEVPRSPGKR